jgi:outer membrane protein assembly factor BamB
MPPAPPMPPPSAAPGVPQPPASGPKPPQIWDTGALPPAPGGDRPDPATPYRQPRFDAHPPPPGESFGPPPPDFDPGRRTRRTAVVIAAAVAGLLVVGGGVWAAVGGGQDAKKPEAGHGSDAHHGKHTGQPTTAPATQSPGGHRGDSDPNDARRPGEATVLYQQPAPQVAESGADIPGFWPMDGYVVKAVQDKIVAYADNGTKKWSVPLPRDVCAAPTTATAGKVVIAYQGSTKDSCSKLAMIDLAKGVKLWDHQAPDGGMFGSSYTGMGISQSGNLAGLSWFGGSGLVRVDNGKVVSPGELSPACSVDGFAGGEALLRAYSCNDGSAKLQQIDTSTGKVSWSYQVPKGYKVKQVYSTGPAVVHITDQDGSSGGILAISARGKQRSVLDLGKQSYQPQCGTDLFGSGTGTCQGVVVTADTCYLPTAPEQGASLGTTAEIHAFDLDTGKKKWAVEVSGRMLLPLRTDGSGLIAYEQPSFDKAGAVVGIPAAGGKPKTLLRMPAATRDAEGGFYDATRTYQHGNFYVASDRLTGSGDDEKLIMAFGP